MHNNTVRIIIVIVIIAFLNSGPEHRKWECLVAVALVVEYNLPALNDICVTLDTCTSGTMFVSPRDL